MDMSGELHTRVALNVLMGNDHRRQPVKIRWVGSSALLDGSEESLITPVGNQTADLGHPVCSLAAIPI